jgi:NADH-quinone oxidoreductase subunit G
MDVRVAMAHGGRNIKTLLDKIKSGEAQYDFVELMACYGGCIGGGGNPKTEFADILQRRAKAVYGIYT